MYLFEMIQQEGRVCSHPTTLCLLKSCINQKSLIHGRLMNDHIIRNGQIFDVSIATSLIDMYAKCGSTDEAQRMFDALSIKNVVTWNVLISGCILGGQNARALLLFERMKKQKEAIYPVKVTYLYILKACGGLIAVQKGSKESVYNAADQRCSIVEFNDFRICPMWRCFYSSQIIQGNATRRLFSGYIFLFMCLSSLWKYGNFGPWYVNA